MKKYRIVLLASLMILVCVTGCKKEKEPDPIEVMPITIEVAEKLIKGLDDEVNGLDGTYKILSINMQNDKSEMKIAYHGENDQIAYDAEYVINAIFKNGQWIIDQFKIVSNDKKEKVPTPTPVTDPTEPHGSDKPSTETDTPTTGSDKPSTSESKPTDEGTISKKLEEYYKAKGYDYVTIKEKKIDDNVLSAKVSAEIRYRYISDVDYINSAFKIDGDNIYIIEEEKYKTDTISNFEGKYMQKGYNGYNSSNLIPYIVFTRDWQFEMYVNASEGVFSANPVLVCNGSYSISNTTLKLNPKKGWTNNGYQLSGSEVFLIPNDGSQPRMFKCEASSVNDVAILENCGTSKSGSHFTKE